MDSIRAIETQLSSTLASADWTNLKEKTDKILTDHQKFLEEKKRQKFQRDNDDYTHNRVYRWSDSTGNNSWRRPYQRKTGSFSTERDSSTGSSRPNFLSKGRRGGYQRSDQQEDRGKNDNSVTGKTSNLVINISGYTLSPAELDILQKGLSFCPTPIWDSFQLERDLQRLYRLVRLKTHFGTLTGNSDNRVSPSGDVSVTEIPLTSLGLRNHSSFNPPHTFHAVETFISFVDKDVKDLSHQHRLDLFPTRANLTPSEKQALTSLHNNIKPADKGGAIVVRDRTQYSMEVLRQLSDTSTYKVVPRDPTFEIRKKIEYVIKTYSDNGTIDQQTAKFLSNPHPTTPVFYILPKIHKSLTNPPGCPIVASTDSILSPLSVFLEKILTPLIKNNRSFILDTSHFLRVLRPHGNVPPDSLLVTMDVNSLYTSITHEKGIAASKLLLENSGKSTTYIQLCVDLLRLVLYENYFLYEDTYYVQCQGTAMGSNFAPADANAYMNSFEENYVYTDIRHEAHINCYLRYIDDIFFIWTGSTDTLQAFHQTLNSIYPELQFTMHFDPTQISFLDTLVRKDDQGLLSTDLFCKPTDCNSLLHYSSSHPKATRNSLPRSQFSRVARIVSDPDIHPTRLEDMSQKFRERKYPQRLLDREKAQVLQPRSTSPNNTNENRVPFVHTFHPFMPKI
ncbi:unnamed protein product [Ranitomeya imitator]|uniref:Reverse transcriptase domain-containing protein n=1 Tax=Ranitomeya imitator TaxID=111125 RepID=A0ABN9KTE7_9NEOB|nr:unnamed protein product [Ranitomeya imitator]